MTLDCRGQRCPQPVIELARAVKTLPQGTVVTISTDDPAAAVDIPAWCRMRGHECRVQSADADVIVHEITVTKRR